MRLARCHDRREHFTGGRVIFADALTSFAAQLDDLRLDPVIARLSAPPSVAVQGRSGVGVRTVAAGLAEAGVTVAHACGADVTVLVIAETLKPEDEAVLAAATGPVIVVLNKADLSGVADGGPMARAHARAAECRARTGVPTVPMIGLLACCALDGRLIDALRTLITHPADLRSTDAFLDGDHRLGRDVRERLLATLDRFGIAHAVLALGRGGDPAALPALLRRLSGVAAVGAALDEAAAPLRYRRMRAALAELRALSVRSGDERLAEFLAGEDTVLAVMAAAVDVVAGAGLVVDPTDDPAAHLRRAVRWRNYGRGPVDGLHRSCAADIYRGSLRLLEGRR